MPMTRQQRTPTRARPLASRLLPLVLLSGGGAMLAGWTSYQLTRVRDMPAFAHTPVAPRFAQRVVATGVVEPEGEAVSIAPPAGLVVQVLVAEGQRIAAGEALLRMDARQVEARASVAAQALAAARQRLARLEALPRAEDAAPIVARLAVAEARLAQARLRRARADKLADRQALSEDEHESRAGAETIAAAEVEAVHAELAQAKLPAWGPDLAKGRAEVAMEQARVEEIAAERERLTITTPRAGMVLAVSVRAGEYLQPGATDPAIVVGDVDHLVVRLEVDESQVSRLRAGAAGSGWIRGDDAHRLELEFLRLVPLARAKAALSGAPDERLDSRAVQVLYRVVSAPSYLRPGLMIEAELDATPVAGRSTETP